MGFGAGDIVLTEEFMNGGIPRECVMKHRTRDVSKDLNKRQNLV